MIKTLRKINFGYYLMIVGVFMIFIAIMNLTNENPPVAAGPAGAGTGLEWLKGPAILLAGIYVIFAGGLKVYKARPKKRIRK